MTPQARQSKADILLHKTKINNNRRQWHICSNCFICDDDLIIALNKMTDTSIEYVIEQAAAILKIRKEGTK